VKKLPRTHAQEAKVHKTLHEFKVGKLRAGEKGPKVTSRKQAIAIALRQAGKQRR